MSVINADGRTLKIDQITKDLPAITNVVPDLADTFALHLQSLHF